MSDLGSDVDVGPHVEGFLLLCDFAQNIGGKLYILGGGWNVMQSVPGAPVMITAAAKLVVPWDLANHRLSVVLRLLDAGSEPIELDAGPVEARGHIEALRGPGLPHGFPLVSTLVTPWLLPGLAPGQYVVELAVEDRIIATETLLIR